MYEIATIGDITPALAPAKLPEPIIGERTTLVAAGFLAGALVVWFAMRRKK